MKGQGACPPGAGRLERKVYLSKGSEIYTIGVYSSGFLGDFPQAEEKCLNKQEDAFNQMLSTFRFLE